MRKDIAVLLIFTLATSLLLCPVLLTTVLSETQSNTPVSAPAITWRQYYGYGVNNATNLIQTSDGGYAFIDLAWSYQISFRPATIYKVDSLGDMQWNQTFLGFSAESLIQTDDYGFEVSGFWIENPTTPQAVSTPSLIKTDSQGNVQWVRNYSSVPDLGFSSSAKIKTSDGGFAYFNDGNITKTDSNNEMQWVINLNYTGTDGSAPLMLISLIETSSGALAALGVGYNLFDNPRTGRIYLIKTEPFLPQPSPTALPTPIPTPSLAPTVDTSIVIVAIVVVVAIAGLLIFLRKRKN